jgi:RES domain-containing protein
MLAYRIAREQYADDLTGEGARLYGGRWNSAGYPMLYAATHRSLAILETLVHLPKNLLPSDMMLVTLSIDLELIPTLRNLPNNWREMPVPRTTQLSGDKWLSTQQVAVYVPSTIVPNEQIVLLNPQSLKFKELVVVEEKEPFYFDKRSFSVYKTKHHF